VVLVLQGLDGERQRGRGRSRSEGRGEHVSDVGDEAEGKCADEDDWKKNISSDQLVLRNIFVIQ